MPIIDSDLEIAWEQCPHVMHSDCIPIGSVLNSIKCHMCQGGGGSAPAAHYHHQEDPIGEPHPLDGRDYVLNPNPKRAPSVLSSLTSLVKKAPPPEDVKTSKNPEFLLKNRVKLPVIIKRNGLGLQHMLAAGIEMIDFLKNGYTWDDLLVFEDISKKGEKRALQAITTGLKTNATHFRDYPDALPFEKVKAHTKFLPKDLCVKFGLQFPEDVRLPIECNGDQMWTAVDCVNMGLSMDHLIDFGMTTHAQYLSLMQGLTTAEMAQAELDLGFTEEHFKILAEQEPTEQVQAQPAPVPKPRTVVGVPAQPAPQPQRLVHTTPTSYRPATSAAPPVKRLESRFDRHGLLLKK